MASQARDAFLQATNAFKAAVDMQAVRAGDPTGDLLRRGLTVSGFNLLETFISSRLGEIATYLNAGQLHFIDLPESLQKRAIRNTLAIATNQSKRMSQEPVDLRGFSKDIGGSLSAVERSLRLSPLTWMWQGSNMASGDYSGILRAFHVKRPWDASDAVAQRLGYTNADLRAALEDLARERHACAHQSLYGVTPLWLRAVPERITSLAITFDVLVSIAAVHLRSGNRDFIRDENYVTDQSVSFRFVRDRGRDIAELVEGALRAHRVSRDGLALYQDAAGRCGDHDAIVRQTAHRGVADWAVPAVS